jgi:hypothetical protein
MGGTCRKEHRVTDFFAGSKEAVMYPAALGWLTHHTVSGIFGAVIFRGMVKVAPQAKPVARKAMVNGMAGGIVVGRWLASAGEEARLRTGDLVAEAQAQLGEEPGPEGTGASRMKSGTVRARRWFDHEH